MGVSKETVMNKQKISPEIRKVYYTCTIGGVAVGEFLVHSSSSIVLAGLMGGAGWWVGAIIAKYIAKSRGVNFYIGGKK
jgi:hypothetical protein